MPKKKARFKSTKKSASKKTKKKLRQLPPKKALSTKTIILIAVALFIINLIFVSIRLYDEKLSVNEYDFMVEIDESNYFTQNECGMSIFKKCYSENFRLPMYFFVQKFFIEVFRFIPYNVFFLSLLCSSGIVVLLFLFLYRFTSLPSALLGTFLYLFTFINYNYSREVEEYVFFAFFILLTFYLYLLWMNSCFRKGKFVHDYRFYVFLCSFMIMSLSQNIFLYVFIVFMLMQVFFCFRCKIKRLKKHLWYSLGFMFFTAIPALILIIINITKYVGIDYVATSFSDRIYSLSINIPLFLDYLSVVRFEKIWELLSWDLLQIPYFVLLFVALIIVLIRFFKKTRKNSEEDELNNRFPFLFFVAVFVITLLLLSSAPNKIYTFFIVYPTMFVILGFGIHGFLLSAKKSKFSPYMFGMLCAFVIVVSFVNVYIMFSTPHDYEFNPSMEYFVDDFLSKYSFDDVSFYTNANFFASDIFHNVDSTLLLIGVNRGFEYPNMCRREYNSEKSYEQIDTGKVLLVDWNMDHLLPMNASVVSLVKENYELVYEYDEKRWFVASYYER